MRSLLFFALLLANLQSPVLANRGSSWNLKKFTSLVAFGDSYTDEQRIGFFASNNGSAPPVGWVEPESLVTSSGGRIWDRYVATYTGANLYDYAVSGAVCSNAISPRTFTSINAPFPAVKEYEVPAFIADSHFFNTTTKRFFLDIPPDETVYTIWIGTNDLGNDAFLTDSQIQGKTLVDYVDCVFDALVSLYKNGARYFVLMNVAPLQLLPQYALPGAGGLAATKYFPDKGPNITEISFRMLESVVTVNGIFEYRTPFEILVSGRLRDAHVAVFDTNALLTDMYNNPSEYLNGSLPLNVTGCVNSCDVTGTKCVVAPNPDSFLWFDELHPSEQTDRQIARAFIDVVKGVSKWATYWG